MRHAKLLIVLCSVAVIAFTVLCARAIFSVSDIVVDYSVYDSAEAEHADELLKRYYGKSLIFLNTQKAEKLIVDNTSLKVVSIKKKFPNKLVVDLKQRKERFAVEVGSNSYAVLDDEYTVIGFSEKPINSNDGLGNIILQFKNTQFDPSKLTLRAQLDIGDKTLLDCVVAMINQVDTPRDYIHSVRLEETLEKGNYRVYFTMLDGVEVEIRKATENSVEKIKSGFQKYLSLEDSQKLSGKIAVYALDSGAISAIYTK